MNSLVKSGWKKQYQELLDPNLVQQEDENLEQADLGEGVFHLKVVMLCIVMQMKRLNNLWWLMVQILGCCRRVWWGHRSL